jgi:hypothetical protein
MPMEATCPLTIGRTSLKRLPSISHIPESD